MHIYGLVKRDEGAEGLESLNPGDGPGVVLEKGLGPKCPLFSPLVELDPSYL